MLWSGLQLVLIKLKSKIFFSHAYDSMYCKIFRTFDSNIISQCQYYSGFLNFTILYELQRYNFLLNLLSNSIIDERAELDRNDYRDFCALKAKYKFEANDSKWTLKFKAWKIFEVGLCLGFWCFLFCVCVFSYFLIIFAFICDIDV